jgi:hypothetical protein
MTNVDWERANCKGIDTDYFYYPNGDDGSDRFLEKRVGAKGGVSSVYGYLNRICNECPIMAECADYAIRNEQWGFWGGLSPSQRQRIRRTLGIVLNDVFDSERYDDYIITQRAIADSLVEEEVWI